MQGLLDHIIGGNWTAILHIAHKIEIIKFEIFLEEDKIVDFDITVDEKIL